MNAGGTRFDAVLFDFDGTLAPNLDLPAMKRRVTAFSLNCGVPREVIDGHYIVEQIAAATHYLATRDIEFSRRYHNRAHAIIDDFEHAAAARTRLFPGMETTLDRLKRDGMRLGIVTRNSASAVRTMCPHLDRWFGAVLCRDDVAHIKPDARHLSDALDRLGATPARAVMVGDGEMDMTSGRGLAMFCVGVLTGSGSSKRLSKAGANLVLETANDLPGALSGAVVPRDLDAPP